MYKLKVFDESTGEIVEDIEFSGGYNIQWTCNEDSGRIHHVTNIKNGKWGEKHWIKNYMYAPIARKLIEKFDELEGININEILFLEDTEWEPANAKYNWKAITRKTNKHFQELTGYKYIVETRQYYTEKMSREQLVILIYHEIRHVDPDDDGLKKHDIEDWNNVIATFGKGWDSTRARLKDILSDEFESWNCIMKTEKQLSIYDNVVPMTKAK
jgi:hypothetical protein